MRFRHRGDGLERHAESLAETARMEMDLGVGDWSDTTRQLEKLLSQASETAGRNELVSGALIEQMRREIGKLRARLHNREAEYDRLQEKTCALQDELAALRARLSR